MVQGSGRSTAKSNGRVLLLAKFDMQDGDGVVSLSEARARDVMWHIRI